MKKTELSSNFIYLMYFFNLHFLIFKIYFSSFVTIMGEACGGFVSE
jgi:hypothetical protein